ncbi:TlpA family protein disulfide reductase [Gemmatimonadota bacterium]
MRTERNPLGWSEFQVLRMAAWLSLPFAASLLFAPPLSAQEVALPVGSDAPAATLEDLDGNPVQILDFVEEGKPTLIEFWASWCHDCEELTPEVDQVHSTYGDRLNVVAVAVAVSQSQRRVKRFVEEQGASFPFLWDGDGEAVRNYKVPGTSVVIILDGAGKVAYTGTGGAQDLMGAVEKLLGS